MSIKKNCMRQNTEKLLSLTNLAVFYCVFRHCARIGCVSSVIYTKGVFSLSAESKLQCYCLISGGHDNKSNYKVRDPQFRTDTEARNTNQIQSIHTAYFASFQFHFNQCDRSNQLFANWVVSSLFCFLCGWYFFYLFVLSNYHTHVSLGNSARWMEFESTFLSIWLQTRVFDAIL